MYVFTVPIGQSARHSIGVAISAFLTSNFPGIKTVFYLPEGPHCGSERDQVDR